MYAAYFFRGIATLALAMTRKFNCYCEARSAAAIPQIKYVILSGSEISHDQSEKYMLVSSLVGFFTAFRMTCKEKYVILRASEISHRKSDALMPRGVFVVKV